MTADLVTDRAAAAGELEDFHRRLATMTPLGQFVERIRLHQALGGAVTADVLLSCAISSDVGIVARRPWRWLESTERLQRESFGFDWEAIGRTPTNVAASLKDNTFAAQIELAEASVEFSWKHWARDEAFVNRDRVLEELVDVGHFVANMLLALGVGDDEWEVAYRAKQDKNRRRMATGTYSARKGGLGDGSEAE